MPKKKTKTEPFYMSMTPSEKTRLEALAAFSGKKSLAQYLIDAGLSNNLDTAKITFYENIQDDLMYIKKTLYVLTKLTLLVANDQYKDQDLIIKFTKAATEEAENYFKP